MSLTQMSFLKDLKAEVVKRVEAEFDHFTQPRLFFHDIEEDIRLTDRKRRLDELYDRAPLYMTKTTDEDNGLPIQSLLDASPNDLLDITRIPHNKPNEVFEKYDYFGLYSDQKDSFMIRGDNGCTYFRLQDDTKRRLVQNFIKTNLNEVAQMVEAENQKIMNEAKESFEAVCHSKQQPVASNNQESL